MTSKIVRTPGVIGGKARVDGTRWPVWIAWKRCVEGGETVRDIVEDYPHLTAEQIEAAIEYARGNEQEIYGDWKRAQGDGGD